MVLPRGGKLFALVLVALATASGVSLAAFGFKRAARLGRGLWKVAKNRVEASDLPALGKNGAGLGFVERILEKKLESPDDDTRRFALIGLVRGFPQNRHTRAIREYEALTGDGYFDGEGAWAKVTGAVRGRGAADHVPLAEAIARWRALVAENPDFPGRDDAGLHLARCLEEAGEARSALAVLLAARSWGDRDARFVIEDRIANVLDAQLPLDDALELAKGSTNALIVYSAAVKLARVHRFDEAVAMLDRFEALAAKGEVDLLGHAPSYFVWRDENGKEVARKGYFIKDVKSQRALWKKLATSAPLARAERLIHEPHAFENLVLHESVKSDREGRSVEETRADERFEAYTRERNHLAQAAALFEDVARTDSASRTRALTGAAVARIGLVGYWGVAPGHAPAGTLDSRIKDAARAMKAALRAATIAQVAAVAATLDAAVAHGRFEDPALWSHVSSKESLEKTLRRALRAGDAPPTFALREENLRGR